VRPRDYITGSWLGMLPATVLYVYAGSAAASLAHARAGGALAGRTAALLLLVLGLAATGAVVVLVTRLARAQLEHELAAGVPPTKVARTHAGSGWSSRGTIPIPHPPLVTTSS